MVDEIYAAYSYRQYHYINGGPVGDRMGMHMGDRNTWKSYIFQISIYYNYIRYRCFMEVCDGTG